jgi:hypothetical protein
MGGGPMPLRLRATSPVYCGKCGRRRGLMHVCVVRRANGRTRIKAPGISLATCSRCGQDYANPFTHTCPSRPGDFKRRKAAAERAERKRKAEQLRQRRREERARRREAGGPVPTARHLPQTCRDEDCQRRACVAYRLGFADGRDVARAGEGRE